MKISERRADPYHGLYFNGLERTGEGKPEKLLLGSLRMRGVDLTHGKIDWHHSEFGDIFEDGVEQAEKGLERHGRLAIIGASMGGSLAVDIYEEIKTQDPGANLKVITLNAWLQIIDKGLLEHTALHRPDKKPSKAAIDSVMYCAEEAIPRISPEDRRADIRTVGSFDDETVPLSAMMIEGSIDHVVGAKRHVPAIVLGMMHTPGILDEMYSQAA